MKQILLIEDDAALKNMYKRVLGQKYNLRFEKSGDLALDYLKENSPDLVITDLHLTDMKGLEIITALKEHGYIKKFPTIVLSNESDSEVITAANQSGIKGYARKEDIELEDLLKLCEEAMEIGG